MIAEAHLVIAKTMQKAQVANSEYATHLIAFGREFLRNAREKEVSSEESVNAAEAIFRRLSGRDMRPVRRRMRETEMKGRRGTLTPLDHDTLYAVIGRILHERGWQTTKTPD